MKIDIDTVDRESFMVYEHIFVRFTIPFTTYMKRIKWNLWKIYVAKSLDYF